MYIKFVISLILPVIYLLIRNHNELKKLDKNNYDSSKMKFSFWTIDLGFLVVLFFSFFPIQNVLLMNLWVLFYMIITSFYIHHNSFKEKIKKKNKYFRRLWRMDIIYLFIIFYILLSFKGENMMAYYALLGFFIYLQKGILLLINEMLIKIEKYKSGSECYED